MAKKTLLSGFLATVAAGALLTSCHDELGGSATKGIGGLDLAVDLNTSVVSSQKTARANNVTASDLALTITSADGEYSHTWASLSDYDSSTEYPIGDYKVEATYGSIESEGFDRPAYYGSTTVTVLENKTTPVSLTASLANSMVSIEYTEEFRNYMADWSADLHSTGGSYLYYGPDETKPIYLRPGNVSLDVDVKKPNGVSATLRVATFEAKPRYHHHITVGLSNGAGDAVLTVTFDETLDKEDVELDLSDELLNAPAPTIKATGLDEHNVLNYFEGSTPTRSTLDVIARGGISEAVLTTSCAALRSQGWPEEINLMDPTEKDLSIMNGLGFVKRGFDAKDGKFAVLDFTNVPTFLNAEAVNSKNEFTLVVVDNYGKVSEPFTFTMNWMELILGISNPSELVIGGTTLNVDLTYNGTNVDDVTFQAKNDRGLWDNLKVTSVTEKDATTRNGEKVYTVGLEVPAAAGALNLRATSGGKTTEALVVNRVATTDFTLTVPENDIWAKRATVVIESEGIDAAVIAKFATVFVSTDGSSYKAATVTGVKGTSVSFAGLTPGTAYFVKVSVSDRENESCEAVRFATEPEAAVPNGDFENIAQTYSANKMNQGGQWSISAGINYQTTVTYTVSEATGWASTNAKTMSGTANTWFRQPSVFNTTLSYSSTVPAIRVVNTGGGTETPDGYKGFSAHSGSNAMVLRNVGWDANGSVPGVWRKQFASTDEYYNHTEPSVANTSVGKMFLGTYSYSNGTETYNQGVDFASRPSALTGWYTFAPDSNDPEDSGVVEVEVMSGSTVIATGTGKLTATSEYTSFNIPLTYVANAPKATSVRIFVASSTHSSGSMAEETANVAVSPKNSRYEGYLHGATLVVDDFKFVY